MRKTAIILATAVLVLAAGGWWFLSRRSGADVEQLHDALARQDYAAAYKISQELLKSSPDDPRTLLACANAAAYVQRFGEAIALVNRVHGAESDLAAQADAMAGNILLQMGEAREAETRLRAALAADPSQLLAHDRLAFLLEMHGRRWDARPHYLELAKAERATSGQLLLLAGIGEVAQRDRMFEAFRAARPRDKTLLLGQALVAHAVPDPAKERELLTEFVLHVPRIAEGQARLGAFLQETDPPAFDLWVAALPEGIEHPAVWRLRGEWALGHEQPREAARCLWEAARRNPNDRVAMYQLSQALVELADAERAKPFAERAALLREFEDACLLLLQTPTDPERMGLAAEQCVGLGRRIEARAWYAAILAASPEDADARSHLEELRRNAIADEPQTVAEFDPASRIDLSSFPLPRVPTADSPTDANEGAQNEGGSGKPATPAAPAARRTGEPSAVAFADQAVAAGLEFTYYNSADLLTDGARMFEFSGGGVGAIDFDHNGWPDVYFTQGCTWPPQEGDFDRVDRLFRNEGDGRFADVTLLAGLGDERFGQGVAVGDYNSDGFADLYVANIGENRLYCNNGDGTFSDATLAAGIGGAAWTTSCVLADLNGDGLPDLYDVTYCQGEDVFDRICSHQGHAGICPPTQFAAQNDRLWLNLGDGRFDNVAAAAGIEAPHGYGLGVVAADLDGTGRLSLFVANDQTANFHFANTTAAPGAAPSFQEQAMFSGLALSREARAQACMGVAAGDADGDGRLDLYVTNYYDEYNTLYKQKPNGTFADVSQGAGLAAPSLHMLGFGTQFLDVDLDGRLDLVVANGHIMDLRRNNIPYAMRPQCMYNLGGGRFRELPADSLGQYFVDLHLGRALARLDWNRDGRDDFCVSHLEEPAALVSNRTDTPNRFLAITLAGVRSNRDAIGTTVAVKAGDLNQTVQLVAGDGYQASNERRSTIGVGPSQVAEELNVRWPSGHKQTFRNLETNREWLLVEGRADAVLRSK